MHEEAYVTYTFFGVSPPTPEIKRSDRVGWKENGEEAPLIARTVYGPDCCDALRTTCSQPSRLLAAWHRNIYCSIVGS
jgi:hypothetical protein